jgi:transcriptional regulator with XRE-family HTH domain
VQPCQCTYQHIQKFESGSARIHAGRLQHLARVLQVPVPFLFEGAPARPNRKGHGPAPIEVSEFLALPEGLALARAATSDIRSRSAK